ncbi:cupredoxin domain-containing protein [Kitasatospora sp. NPDC057542]|uniref:cupredoxin domain-containing protein n=1 Tax=Streptomycetaceae TaxID=2062 RepID=UPI001CCF0F2B|nr:cupredoxin domain-containing protein [Streptomyces sp. LS1784]
MRPLLGTAALLLLAVGPVLTGCVSSFVVPGPEEATSSVAVPSVPSAPVPSPSPFTGTVTIRDFSFEPGDFTAAPGAVVTVTNTGTTAHSLTAQDGGFDTGAIAPGATATLTAPTQPGAYSYLCTFHHFMRGILTVA